MSAFINHFLFEFKTGIRNKQLLLLNYLFPLGIYLMMGSIFPQINPPFLEVLIPAMVVFGIVASTLLGIPDPLVSAREKGIFRSYKINGVPSSSILIIPALTTILHLAVVTALITTTAPLFFNAPLPVDTLTYILVFFVTAFACAGIGVLISVISSSTRMTVLWSQLVFLPSMIVGGIMMPTSILPDAFAKISMLLPSTHAMNAFNGLAMGRTGDFNPWGSVIVLLLGGLISFATAFYLFKWEQHDETQRGHPLMALLILLPYITGMFLLQ